VFSSLNKELIFSGILESANKIELRDFLSDRSLVKTHIFNEMCSMQSSAYVSMYANNHNVIQES
jgi:hypothetical protein